MPRLSAVLSTIGLILAALVAGCSSTGDAASTPQATVAEAPPPTTASTSTTAPVEPTTTLAPTAPPIEPPPPIAAGRDGWELVWADEFEGEQIDRSNWTYDIGGWGWGNGEAQYYTDAEQNSRVENGLLVIEARFERFDDNYYTSARLKTRGLREFQYGRVEARMLVPTGAGTWPAFWMLGSTFEEEAADEANRWPFVGEIDIMEHLGREPDLIMGTIHGPGYAGALGLTKWNRREADIAEDWHTYAIEWDENGITWFFDDEPYNTFTRESVGTREWVFDKEFFLIVNLALGGQFPGPIGLDVEFPRTLHLDYVRVYQRPGSET